ncbi:MAG TPA: TlpA disulfide reductase family protein [Bacteroidales bacterium]|nr:TlpA disulfide reductase family protein [Bacteroidales bacterium]HPS51829.1 TlpA disulfide reductase family protein [Bacteroidales bacterium]
MRKIILPVVLLLLLPWCQTVKGQEILCHLKGVIVDRDSKNLLLFPETEDPLRSDGITIPIVNNTFVYDLKVKEILKYQLIFQDELKQGVMRPITFFPANGSISFTLHDMNSFNKNRIEGGDLNRRMLLFDKTVDSIFTPMLRPYTLIIDSLWKADAYFSDTVNAINQRLRLEKSDQERSKLFIIRDKLEQDGDYFSPSATHIMLSMDSLKRIKMFWINDYLQKNMDLVSYSYLYYLLNNYRQNEKITDLTFIDKILPEYRAKYPRHTYTVKIEKMINAIDKLKVGEYFIDFEAPTVNGNMVRISDSIRGKVALLNLWASWCGPCRGLGKSMIPVYEKFRESGFVIIGVANEYRNTDAFKAAIKKDRYPWLNLVELNNVNGIWDKYNIAGSGGCTYLIGRDGKIIAIHPDAAELERLLTELF